MKESIYDMVIKSKNRKDIRRFRNKVSRNCKPNRT